MPRTVKKFILYMFTNLLLLIGGCSKDEPRDCGCGKGSEVVFTIEDSDEQTGYLYRATGPDNPDIPDYKFGIWFTEESCGGCTQRFFICNNSFLSDFGDIPAYPGIEVKFSGKVKDLCEDPPVIGLQSYNHLIVTRVELK